MSEFAELAVADLLLRLRALNRAIRRAVAACTERSGRIHGSAAGELYVSDDHAHALLREVDAMSSNGRGAQPPRRDPKERAALSQLRARARECSEALPLDDLAARASLDEFEVGCVVACAAPEIEPAYQRLYGYVVDDLGRMRPSVELLLALSGAGTTARLALRGALGPAGTLRRNRILVARGEPAFELRQELVIGPGVLDCLLGVPSDRASLAADADDVRLPEAETLPAGVDGSRVRRLADALGTGTLSMLAVWGGDDAARERVAAAAARRAGLGLRRFDAGPLLARNADPASPAAGAALAAALRIAAALHAMLWVDCDPLPDEDSPGARAFEAIIRGSEVPVCLTAKEPWRPARVLAARRFAEIQLDELGFASRRRLWADALPELAGATAADLAARFPIGASQVDAAAALARVEAAVSPNGTDLGRLAEIASAKVARARSYRFATVVRPSRTADDLVLPEDLHTQVTEIAAFYRSWPLILEDWRLGRLTAAPGFRVLFTGEPGTGKTLAAEVIAGELGLDLLKISLARVVSKWVGETEQNLEAGFDEAERSASVLFFDEADALFSKRGEVRHGTDRYSNLEVAYLLQRMESYSGLVVLATNLRDNLDDAFTRRFNVILHFPRPAPEQRRRIWERALSLESPAHAVDLDALAEVDMTGAAIVAVAQTAALLAAGEGSARISMRHVIRATARQFQREGRLLSRAELGEHAALL